MNRPLQWEKCLDLRGAEAESFSLEHFGEAHRRALLIAGAGFDPRSTEVARLLSAAMGDRLLGCFIREERPNPASELVHRANANVATLTDLIPAAQVSSIDVFASDGAVVGGRRATQLIGGLNLAGVSDLIVDCSALSLGAVFPIVRYLLQVVCQSHPSANLHVMVAHQPETDDSIVSVASDRADPVFGFRGVIGVAEHARAARLWLPHLVRGKRAVLERIHAYVRPHDTCPVLPFPSKHWRLGDMLLEEYREGLEGAWEVDSRNIVYAAENSPLDLYRTLLRIADARTGVFSQIGGSLVILSPIGSKLLSIGALMAALERDFPVVYVESVGYEVDWGKVDSQAEARGELVHLWLAGEAHATPLAPAVTA